MARPSERSNDRKHPDEQRQQRRHEAAEEEQREHEEEREGEDLGSLEVLFALIRDLLVGEDRDRGELCSHAQHQDRADDREPADQQRQGGGHEAAEEEQRE